MSEAYLLYIKGSGSLFGVPARNLTFEEASIAGEKRLIDSGMYKLSNPKQHRTYMKRSKNDIKDEVRND